MTTNKKLHLKNEYNTWFNSSYYHILYKNRDYKEAKEFVKTILKHLKLEKQSSILDAACGKGRHSIEMERLGYKVLGIDLSNNSINEAKKFKKKNTNLIISTCPYCNIYYGNHLTNHINECSFKGIRKSIDRLQPGTNIRY